MIWWAIGAVLLAVAAASIYAAFQSPGFVASLTALAAAAAWKAVAPTITKRMPPEEEAAWRKASRGADGGDAFMRKRRGFPPKG